MTLLLNNATSFSQSPNTWMQTHPKCMKGVYTIAFIEQRQITPCGSASTLPWAQDAKNTPTNTTSSERSCHQKKKGHPLVLVNFVGHFICLTLMTPSVWNGANLDSGFFLSFDHNHSGIRPHISSSKKVVSHCPSNFNTVLDSFKPNLSSFCHLFSLLDAKWDYSSQNWNQNEISYSAISAWFTHYKFVLNLMSFTSY